MDSNKKNVF